MNYLKQFKYQKNIAVVHSDASVLPVKKAWSSWNYTSVNNLDGSDSVSVSYLINMLQPLPTEKPVIVTLNPVTPIDPNKVFKKIDYKHPLFDDGTIKAQTSIQNIQGQGNIYFAGAWLRYGFHEDGILSSKLAIDKFFTKIGQVEESFVIL
jgi:predicted NAD/FAD-binding protein